MNPILRKTTVDFNCFGIVYKMTCLVNGKVYIGVTCRSVIKRWWGHTEPKKKNPSLLHKAVSKYGKDSFSMEIIAFAKDKDHLDFLEKCLIYLYSSHNPKFGYNIKEGGISNWKHSPETIEKVRKSCTGRKHSEETKALMRKSHTGVKKSPEHIAKVKAFHTGRKRSPEIVQGIRDRAKKLGKSITLTKDGEIFKFDSIREACRELNICRSSIRHVLSGRARFANGYEVLNGNS